ncbi:unnamed protein product [Vicia faba]|uniref:Uncharacterized protein n=1 Tax=Vicia faba TaxID=3906 RepID=A0AAV1B2D5_VICFA|nr:unnamed protein product [Vicia faba]
MLPIEWWDFYGDITPKLKRFRIGFTLKCFSFEDIHSDPNEWITEDPNEENMQAEVNVEQDDVIVNNVMEVNVVVTNVVQSGGCGKIELGGSGTSSSPTWVNDEEVVSS